MCKQIVTSNKSYVPGELPIRRPCDGDEKKKAEDLEQPLPKLTLPLHIELGFLSMNVYLLVIVRIKASRMYIFFFQEKFSTNTVKQVRF